MRAAKLTPGRECCRIIEKPSRLVRSIQRENEEVARRLELVIFHRMNVATARLHGDILLRPDRVGDRRALEWRADVEAPKFLKLFVVIGDHPAVLQCREDDATGRNQRTGPYLDVGDGLGQYLV